MIRLSKEEFDSRFDELYENMKQSFFKLETLQEYSEDGFDQWNDLDANQLHEKIIQAQETIKSFREEDRALISRGISLERVRVLNFPLTKYCLHQLSVYKVSQNNGEKIFIIDDEKRISDIDDSMLRDFVLFDDSALLIHDFAGTEFTGGVFSDKEEEVLPYVKLKNKLKKLAVPYDRYLELINLSIIKVV